MIVRRSLASVLVLSGQVPVSTGISWCVAVPGDHSFAAKGFQVVAQNGT